MLKQIVILLACMQNAAVLMSPRQNADHAFMTNSTQLASVSAKNVISKPS